VSLRGPLLTVVALLLGGAYGAWHLFGPPSTRERVASLRDSLRASRAAADSCQRALSYEEALFRDYDERVDSLRNRVRHYESLDPEGVPADSYEVYLETFDRYNDAVPAWRERADTLQTRWAECRTLIEDHNELADSVRTLLVEEELISEPILPSEEDGGAGGSALRNGGEGPGREDGAAEADEDAADAAVVATDEDWRILEDRVAWARERGLDRAPVGEAVAALASSFVGTPYTPWTLEVEGPERPVVNLRGLDCVTLVETVLAAARLVRHQPPEILDDSEALREAYVRILTRLRYRGGILDGYPSRLHYFSEWIRDAEEKGFLRNVTGELGGVEDPEPVHFMSNHPDAYRQLADPRHLEALRGVEERLSARPRIYVPEDRLSEAAPRIRTGDVIAATSSVEGLDVAHTGIAVRVDGELRLLHAPLVGDSVRLSERTLPERIAEISGQDGVIVARPLN